MITAGLRLLLREDDFSNTHCYSLDIMLKKIKNPAVTPGKRRIEYSKEFTFLYRYYTA